MLGLRKAMKVVLEARSRSIDVAGALTLWAAAAFIACLALVTLDHTTRPHVALIATAMNSGVVAAAMGVLRGIVVWRRR